MGEEKSRVWRAALVVLTILFVESMSFAAWAGDGMEAVYQLFQFGNGWGRECRDNTYGRAAAGSYVTALKVTLNNQPEGMTGTVTYQVNLSGSGWLGWVENFAEAGATDTDMPLEAVKMMLTGELAEHYDIYYSVFQNGAWTELVMNGEVAGAEGQGLRVDGVRAAIREKGAGVPEEPQASGRVIDPTRPMVALTFDDGPSIYTPRILDALERNGGASTFFMVGNRIGTYAPTVKRMAELGCEPASHTWAHTYLTGMSQDAIITSLNQVDAAIMAAAGVPTAVMRPPGGYINQEKQAVLAAKGVPAVMWSLDTRDWKTQNAQNTINVVLGNVKDGDIILMHDLYDASAAAAEVLIPELTNRGYQLVTVSELAAFRGGMAPGHIYSQFRP